MVVRSKDTTSSFTHEELPISKSSEKRPLRKVNKPLKPYPEFPLTRHNLYWQLDVTFHEDQLRIGINQAPVNIGVLLRTALSLLKQEHGCRQRINTKRLCVAMAAESLEKVLLEQGLTM